MFYLLIVIVLLFASIVYLLFSINGHLSKIASSHEVSYLADKITESSTVVTETLSSMDDRLQEIDQTLRDIKYVTDLHEKYKLPAPHERADLDQILLDNEIDSMLHKSRTESDQ